MTERVSPGILTRLHRVGLLKEFINYYKTFKHLPKDEAEDRAIKKYMPLLENEETKILKSPAADKAGCPAESEGSATQAEKPTKRGRGRSKSSGGQGSPATPKKSKLKITPSLLAKEPDVVDVIEWVAKHLDVTLSTRMVTKAPGAAAVSMLQHYRKEQYRKDFWALYAKLIPNKTQLSGRQKIELDGEKTIDLIDRIMKLKEK